MLDAMSARQRASLSEQARKILAKVPATSLSLPGTTAGMYQRQSMTIPIINKQIPIGPGRIKFDDTNKRDRAEELLHESLHAIAAQTGADQMRKFPTLSQKTREDMYRRYYEGPPRYTNESHISSTEAYATAGQQGYYNIPQELKSYYANVLPAPVPGQVRAGRARQKRR